MKRVENSYCSCKPDACQCTARLLDHYDTQAACQCSLDTSSSSVEEQQQQKERINTKQRTPQRQGHRKTEFTVIGMTCASCVGAVESYVATLEGVSEVAVNLLAGKAVVTFDAAKISPQQIAEEISGIGFNAAEIQRSIPGKAIITILGIVSVEDGKKSVEPFISQIPGVKSVEIQQCPSHPHIIAIVHYEANHLKLREILKLLNENGFHAGLHFNDSLAGLQRKNEIKKYRSLVVQSSIFAIPALILMILMWIQPMMLLMENAYVVPGLSSFNFIFWVLATPVQFWIGRSFYIHSYKTMRKCRPTMDVLIVLGTTVAYFASMIQLIVLMANPPLMMDPLVHATWTINDQVFEPTRVDISIPLGSVEEWTIRNLDEESFHIHQVHFQVTSINGVEQSFHGYQDTITLPAATKDGNSEVKILIPFVDPVILGKFLYHCHILKHEDNGMMGVIEVIDN